MAVNGGHSLSREIISNGFCFPQTELGSLSERNAKDVDTAPDS